MRGFEDLRIRRLIVRIPYSYLLIIKVPSLEERDLGVGSTAKGAKARERKI